jgi:2-methylisocitrate lyase-like PEP mutase family enzyme
MTEFGKTPLIPLRDFAQMGYAVVIYPVSMLRVAMGAVDRALKALHETGTVEPPHRLDDADPQRTLRVDRVHAGVAWEWPVR